MLVTLWKPFIQTSYKLFFYKVNNFTKTWRLYKVFLNSNFFQIWRIRSLSTNTHTVYLYSEKIFKIRTGLLQQFSIETHWKETIELVLLVIARLLN